MATPKTSARTTKEGVLDECRLRFRAAAGRDFTEEDRERLLAELSRRRKVQADLRTAQKHLAAFSRYAAAPNRSPGLAEGARAVAEGARVEMLAASMRRTRTRTLLLSILGRGPIFGGRWSDRAALKMPQHVAVVAFLCGITRPSPAQLRSDTPAQIIDRESTTIGKLVDKWASDRAARVALERSLLRRGVREGAELEGLLAAMIWAGDA